MENIKLGSDFLSFYSYHARFCNDGDGGWILVSPSPLRHFLCDPSNWPDGYTLLGNF